MLRQTSYLMFCWNEQLCHLLCVPCRARPARTLAGRSFAGERRRVGTVPESQRGPGGRALLIGNQLAWPRGRPTVGLHFVTPPGDLSDDRNFAADTAGPIASTPQRPTPPCPALGYLTDCPAIEGLIEVEKLTMVLLYDDGPLSFAFCNVPKL